MATSGSVDFSVSRDDLIKAAMQYAGVLEEGGTPSATQLTENSLLLNMIVKARMADGMPLWALKEGYALPITGTNVYSIGNSAHVVSSYTTTTLASNAAIGTTIVVSSATGISSGYAIGVELDDSTMHWTTVNGAPAGTTVTLTAALTDTAGAGNRVWVYNTANRIVRPLRVISAYIGQIVDDVLTNRWVLNIVPKDKWLSLGNPTATGTPNQIWYDPQLTTGDLHVYPRFLGGDQLLEITYHRPFDDFDAGTDTPDFPQEWYLALMLELAALIGAKSGVPLTERRSMQAEATAARELALSNGTEEGSLFLQPDTRWQM